jgi:hypothetical protein
MRENESIEGNRWEMGRRGYEEAVYEISSLDITTGRYRLCVYHHHEELSIRYNPVPYLDVISVSDRFTFLFLS